MSINGLGLLGGPGNAMRFQHTRGRIGGGTGGNQGVNYPSPFFDVAHTYLPVTVKQLFRWCRYYFLTHPLLNAIPFKLSEYAVTDLVVEHPDKNVCDRWMEILQDGLNYRSFQIEVGLDYFVYGNAFISLSFPFNKFLTCSSCNWSEQAKKCRNNWVFTNYAFRLACPKCGQTGDAKVKDQYLRNANGVKLLRWSAEDIEMSYNDFTGEATYFYTIPAGIRNDIVIGRKEMVEGVPQIFIQALKEQKGVVLSPDHIFHLKRPSLAGQDRLWGMPLILPVLKDTYYLQLMKKAQEAILLEHIVPLRVLFPQPASGTADPFSLINLQDWRDQVASEITRWRLDNNYIPILPLPIGNQTIGGDGRALLLTAEIREWSEQLCGGMGVPREFVFGGLSYSGSSVSLRMLENSFIGYVTRHKQLLKFVMRELANFLEYPEAKAHFKPFKMADDMPRKQYRMALNQAGKVSDRTLLADDDMDSSEEDKIITQENKSRMEAMRTQQLGSAQIQAEAQMIMMKGQAKAQQAIAASGMGQAPGEPGGADPALAAGGGTPGGQAVGDQPGGPSAMPTAPGGAPGAAPDPMAGAGTVSPSQEFDATIGSQLSMKSRMGNNVNVDLVQLAQMTARQYATMDPMHQQLAIKNLQASNPELADLVMQFMSQNQQQSSAQEAQNAATAKGNGGSNGAVDMRPNPEQRPARRERPNM